MKKESLIYHNITVLGKDSFLYGLKYIYSMAIV